MNEEERYRTIDLPFYEAEIAPLLPPEILDFHTHVWRREHTIEPPYDAPAARYMVTFDDYPVEKLLSDAASMFPDHQYGAVCFGNPTPSADVAATNAEVAAAGKKPGVYPLFITGKGMHPRGEIERQIHENGFYGYKVFLNWRGNDYGNVSVSDMIGPDEMSLADELKLIVLLHVPRAGRLADPEIQRGVRQLSLDYPNAQIVLAHCGRAYLPDEMTKSIDSVRDLHNVYLDTAMVMDPTVLQIVFENIDSERVLFATDLPVASMRGRRVYVMDHWVDIVLEGYPQSAYRVASDAVRATFMTYEIILAVARAAKLAGLSDERLAGVFHGNGMRILRRRDSEIRVQHKAAISGGRPISSGHQVDRPLLPPP